MLVVLHLEPVALRDPGGSSHSGVECADTRLGVTGVGDVEMRGGVVREPLPVSMPDECG